MTITLEEIKAAVTRSNTEIDFSKIEPATNFSDYGADSLDIFNIILEIQNLTGIEIPDSDVEELDSLDSIYRYLHDKHG